MSKRKYIIPIFISHLGCTHDCSFCNQRFITKKLKPTSKDEISIEIDRYMSYFPENAEDIELAFYGGSFTGLEKSLIEDYLDVVNKHKLAGKINGIRLSTRPDYINEEILDLLKDYNVTTIELGVQSMIDSVLEMNNRGSVSKDTVRAVSLIRKYKFRLGLQMMTGMYGSSREKDFISAYKISELNPDFVRIYPTMVLPNTHLEHLYKTGEYSLVSLDETIESLKDIVSLFELKNIFIIRIALPDEADDNKLMLGPWHCSLRQLVYQDFYKNIIASNLNLRADVDKVEIYVNKEKLSYLVGYKARNKEFLEEKYPFCKFVFKSKDIDSDKIVISFNGNEIELDLSCYFEKRLERDEIKEIKHSWL